MEPTLLPLHCFLTEQDCVLDTMGQQGLSHLQEDSIQAPMTLALRGWGRGCPRMGRKNRVFEEGSVALNTKHLLLRF